MNPLKPVSFKIEEIDSLVGSYQTKQWEAIQYLLDIAAKFPSLILSYSAKPGTNLVAEKLALSLNQLGLNVFLPSSPTPLSALSLTLGERSFPIGLYIDRVADNLWSFVPLAAHGGLVDCSDIPLKPPLPLQKKGVCGETNIISGYLSRISGLLDPNPEYGIRLSSLESPFSEIDQLFSDQRVFKIFSDRDPSGPKATIDETGQSLVFSWPNETFLSIQEMVTIISIYLVNFRHNGGTVLGPPGNNKLMQNLKDSVEPLEIEGDSWDMSYKASFVNLFLGWWGTGIIAHQGHSPFGDAYLTLAFLLEALSAQNTRK